MAITDNLSEYVLGILSTSEGEPWTPVHLQKVFFLLDNRLQHDIHGPRWHFYAHDYGPFDPAVFEELNALEAVGKASIDFKGGVRSHRLTVRGQREGERALAELSPTAQEYIGRLTAWASALSFTELVSAVYAEFPEMRAKAVFAR